MNKEQEKIAAEMDYIKSMSGHWRHRKSPREMWLFEEEMIELINEFSAYRRSRRTGSRR